MCGFSSITVDMQHGVRTTIDGRVFPRDGASCGHAPGAGAVEQTRHSGKALDGGAWGIIAPMIDTREQAQAMVAACRYPAQGSRSNGPIRHATYGVPSDYQKIANGEVLVIPMIEPGRRSTISMRSSMCRVSTVSTSAQQHWPSRSGRRRSWITKTRRS